MAPPLIYLASPYSHPDPAVRQARYEAACRAVALLAQKGIAAFSPIVHSHPCTHYGLPADWDAWAALDRRFLEACDEVWVLMLEGWEESRGVAAEIGLATQLGKPVAFIHEDASVLFRKRPKPFSREAKPS